MILICPNCKRYATLLFRPREKDYKLLEHYTDTDVKCATSNTVYSGKLAEQLFRGKTQ